MPKITKRVVDAAAPGDKPRFTWDSELRGFGLLVMPSGTRSYVVQYRNAAGRSRRFTIGRSPPLTPDQARDEARALLVQVSKGGDPVEQRKDSRAAPSVGDLFDQYLREHVDRHNAASTAAEVRRLVEKRIKPKLGHLQVHQVTSRDVARLHAGLVKTPRQANYVLAIISKAFGLAEQWKMRPAQTNPARGIKRFAEAGRERFLSEAELGRLGAALVEAEGPGLPWALSSPDSKHLPSDPEAMRTRPNPLALAAIRLLLFTGCRLSEILALEWAHVDIDAGLLLLPSYKGGDRRPHPVSGPVIAIIGDLAAEKRGKFVLPGDAEGKRHLGKTAIEKTWWRLRTRAGIKDVRIHDLRHGVGTLAGQLGGNAFGIRDLLRHKNVTITSRYVNADAAPIRAMSEAIGARLEAALAAKSGAGET